MKISSPEYVRKVKAGDIVTIKFDSHSQKNHPVSPSIHRVRRDVTWKDITQGYSRDDKSIMRLRESNILDNPNRVRDVSNFRHVFESFARANQFDPLVPENWYSVTRNMFATHTGAQGVMNHYRKLTTALISEFPEITFKESKFITKSTRYWRDLGTRKEFFDKYAKERGFDPLVPANWYEVPKEAIQAEHKARSILYYYNMNVAHALMHLYPDIGLRLSGFSRNKRYWDSSTNRRRLFDRIAEANSFDPLVPSNWYSLSTKVFAAYRDASMVLEKYGGNHIKALLDLYPDIGLKEHKFDKKKSSRYWKDMRNRRAVFDRLAKEMSFEPLVARNWYAISRGDIIKDKEASAVLEHYKGSFIRALVHIYPDVSFNKFMVASKRAGDYWKEISNQREFFLNIASTRNFDPLVASNWYNISKSTIRSYKNVTAVLKYYAGNFQHALIQLFPEIPFSESNFAKGRKRYWYKAQNRADLFNSFARDHNFDPRVPQNWYTVSLDAVLKYEGGRALIANYEGSLARALIDTFPNIGLRKKRFS